MTKAEIVNNISGKLGLEKSDTQRVVESFMEEVIKSLVNGENVYLRGFVLLLLKRELKKQVETLLKEHLSLFLRITCLHSNLRKLSSKT